MSDYTFQVASDGLRGARTQMAENSGRLARAHGSWESTGTGEVVLEDAFLFGVTFVEEPSVEYGCSLPVLDDVPQEMVTGSVPRTNGGVYRWVRDARGFYTGANVFFTVDFGPGGVPRDYTINHSIVFTALALKDLPRGILENLGSIPTGEGDESEPEVPDTEPPTVPENLTATAMSQSRVTLEWEASTDNAEVADYRVWVDGVEVAVVTGAVLTFDVTGLDPDTEYDFQVSAVDTSNNESALSAVVPETTLAPDTTAPTVPTDLFATAMSQSQIDVDWTASTDAVGVAGYKVYRDGVLRATITSGLTWSNTGLAADTEYDYQVLAYDEGGNESALTAVESATTFEADIIAPTVPTGLDATAFDANRIDLDWNASTDAVGVTGYDVYRDGVLRTTVTATAFNDTGLAADTEYDYQVRAFDAAGNDSALSAVVTESTPAGPPPPPPPPPGSMLIGCSASPNNHGGTEDWDIWRVYTSSKMYNLANRTGSTRPLALAYSEDGASLSGSYATVYNHALSVLNQFYYGGTGNTHSARWGIKLYWSNGNENSDKAPLTLPHTTAKINAYIESQRGLYDAVHYAPGGTRRFPDAYAGTNPTQFQESQGHVQGWLHPSARYMDFIMWSMYPPGRTQTGSDPTYNWPSLADSARATLQPGFLARCYYRHKAAEAAARAATGNNSLRIGIGCGEVGIASDPGDQNSRPFYAVRGLFGPMQEMATARDLDMLFACWWDQAKSTAGAPQNILTDEPGGTNPSTATAIRNWQDYHPRFGGAHAASWSGKPGNIGKQTGTMP